MAPKPTLKDIQRVFRQGGCTLLATKYINCKTKMPYVCECGRKAKIPLASFKRGGRCKKCHYRKVANKRKHSLEFVQSYFESQGCRLLSDEYDNNETPLRYICKCGEEAVISFGHFQNGKRCKGCGGNKKLTLKQVRIIFKEHGCTLLATEYKDNKYKMPFICECGKKSEIGLNNLRRGQRCRFCALERRITSADQILSHEYVRSFFKEKGCELLAQYANANTKMPYICKCGNRSMISWSKFRIGRRCFECAKDRRSEAFRHNIDIVRDRFKSAGLTLLSDNYINSHSQLWYQCQTCCEVNQTTLASIDTGAGCRQCGLTNSAASQRLSYEEVRIRFKVVGLTLLSKTYKNSSTSLKYQCDVCGYIGTKQLGKVSPTNAASGGCRSCSCKMGRQLALSWERFDFDLGKISTIIKERQHHESPASA